MSLYPGEAALSVGGFSSSEASLLLEQKATFTALGLETDLGHQNNLTFSINFPDAYFSFQVYTLTNDQKFTKFQKIIWGNFSLF